MIHYTDNLFRSSALKWFLNHAEIASNSVKTALEVISSFAQRVVGIVAPTLVKLPTYALKLCHRDAQIVNV